MPIANQPLLTISPAQSTKSLQELKTILNILLLGAFGKQTGIRATLAEDTGHAALGLEFVSDMDLYTAVGIANRLADAMLDVIGAQARELGVEHRLSRLPCYRTLKLPGLSWHQIQRSFKKLIATSESLEFVELVCGNTGRRLRISTSRSLAGYSDWLCDTVIQRRATLGGEIVKIRSGRHEMSFAMPRDISALMVSDGAVISTTPIVGKISRRLLKIRRCQLSLLDFV